MNYFITFSESLDVIETDSLYDFLVALKEEARKTEEAGIDWFEVEFII